MSAEQRENQKPNPAGESLKQQGDKLAKQVRAVVEKSPQKDEQAGKTKPEEGGQR